MLITCSSGSTEVEITRDGLVMTFVGAGLSVIQDVLGNYGIVAPNGVTINDPPTIDPAAAATNVGGLGTANYIGGIMIDPEGLIAQGFDPRSTAGVVTPGTGFGPSGIYDPDLAETLPLTVDASSGPKTVWFYRGLDTVQSGGSNCGCGYMVQITIFSSAPPANWIRPTIYAGDKTVYTTADIDYDLFTPIEMPSGEVEPDWDDIHYLNRPLIQTGQYVSGVSLLSQCNPCGSQANYPADQAYYTNNLLVGCVSDSADREDLINRVVASGLDIHAQVQFGGSQFTAGGGFGCGYQAVRWFAGQFLGIPSMLTTPPKVDTNLSDLVDYFAEDGHVYLGAEVEPDWPDGKPLYGVLTEADPLGPFTLAADTPNDVVNGDFNIYINRGGGQTRTIAGAPTMTASISGTNMTVTAKNGPVIYPGIFLSGTGVTAGTTIVSQSSGDAGGTGVYVVSASQTVSSGTITGSGWSNTLKKAIMTEDWASNPQAGDAYEYYNGGTYEALNLKPQTAMATAVVATGLADEWDNSLSLIISKRWVDDGGTFAPAEHFRGTGTLVDPATSSRNHWAYNSDTDGTWTKKFYAAVVASWPTDVTQGDVIAPVVETLLPFNGEASVDPDADLVIVFDEAVVAVTGDIELRDGDHNLIETFDVTTDVTIDDEQVTFTPAAPLDGPYYVLIDAGTFEDAAGNPFAGIASPTGWQFTTEAGIPITIFEQALNDNADTQENNSIRVSVPITGHSAGFVRVTFEASSAGAMNVDNAAIGIDDGNDDTSTTATPVELLFSGVSGFTRTAGQTITSDWVALPGFDTDDHLVVVIDFASSNGNPRTRSGLGSGFYLGIVASSNTYNSAAGTGLTFSGHCRGVIKIETSASGD